MNLGVNAFSRISEQVINRLDGSCFTAEPGGQLQKMCVLFRSSWLEEAMSLLTVCERSLHLSFENIRNNLLTWDINKKWAPSGFLHIADLRIALEKQDITSVMDSLVGLKSINLNELYDSQLRFSSILSEDWERSFIDHMRRYEPKDKEGRNTLVLPIINYDINPHILDIYSAWSQIGEVEPAYVEEFNVLSSRIKFFQGRVLRGETNTRVYGAIFFRLPPVEYDQKQYWIEHLIHEIAHLRLELLRVHDPLVLNDPTQKYNAPFRRDKRPMLGVYHATFVLSRILHVLSLMLKKEDNIFILSRYRCLRDKFDIGVKEISTFGILSELGEQVFNSMKWLALHAAHK